MNVEKLHKECEMDDLIGLAYNELNDAGFHGDYNDSKTLSLENALHDTYHAVLRGAAKIADFKIFINKYCSYLKEKSRKG